MWRYMSPPDTSMRKTRPNVHAQSKPHRLSAGYVMTWWWWCCIMAFSLFSLLVQATDPAPAPAPALAPSPGGTPHVQPHAASFAKSAASTRTSLPGGGGIGGSTGALLCLLLNIWGWMCFGDTCVGDLLVRECSEWVHVCVRNCKFVYFVDLACMHASLCTWPQLCCCWVSLSCMLDVPLWLMCMNDMNK